MADAYEIGNQHGYLCPKCGKGNQLRIDVTISTILLPDGCDNTDSDTEWDDTNFAQCNGCSWTGAVKDLQTVEIED